MLLSRFASLVCLAGVSGLTASAQFGAYATASGTFVGSTGTLSASQSYVEDSGFGAYGATFGAYGNFLHFGPVKLGADARYFFASSSNGSVVNNKVRGGLGGPRLAISLPFVPLKPYVQGEFGGVLTNYGFQSNEVAKFAYQVQAGVDYSVLPHLDVRFEYGGGQVGGVFHSQSLQQVGLGGVLRF